MATKRIIVKVPLSPEISRKDGTFQKLPPELKEWQNKVPTGKELESLIESGLH